MKYIILLCLFSLAACDNADAMAKCEKTHSYDECFYAMNR